MVEITKVKTQSFMEALDTEGISNEMRQQIMKKAETHYVTIMESVLDNFVSVPDLPLFINVLRSCIAAFKMVSPEQFEKALQMLPEENLQAIAEEILREENDSGVMS